MAAWLPLLIALAIVYVMYKRSQSSAPVAVAYQVDPAGGPLEAIEYFWRPG